MGKFKCDSCFHKKVCQESPAYGTVMEDCPSYINVEIDNSLQQLKAEIAAFATCMESEFASPHGVHNIDYYIMRLRQLSAV